MPTHRDVADAIQPSSLEDAEAVLNGLIEVWGRNSGSTPPAPRRFEWEGLLPEGMASPNLDAKYRTLVEQIPAVVFMINLDKGVSEAYVSPQIEALLGFSQQEWLEDPVRWYERIHPGDRARWSVEAANLFLAGEPLRSVYRVIARDGRVVWFHCEAKMVRRDSGDPWFIHGVGFDITELKQTEQALHEERNFAAAILDTVDALIVVLDPGGRIVNFNRACQRSTGYSFDEVRGRPVWEVFASPEEREESQAAFGQLRGGKLQSEYHSNWVARDGTRRLIAWSNTVLLDAESAVEYVIATGIDITESKRLEKALLDVNAREQRRIGEDLHDGLGQHLTGIAFMGKVLEEKLAERRLAEAEDADKIVRLVNEAIDKTRELARGLLPVVSEASGLMSALRQRASEVSDLFHVDCRFECDSVVLLHDELTATHLYRIAQEAVNNAIKHGRARHIVIRLASSNDRLVLTVEDDGAGFSSPPEARAGLGLHLMSYRAKMIGGSLEVRPGDSCGVVVSCDVPATPRA